MKRIDLANTSTRGKIFRMKVGDRIIISAAETLGTTLRNYASAIGADYGRKYSVSYDRCGQTYQVTRNA